MELKELKKIAQQVKEKGDNKDWKKAIEGIVWKWKKTSKLTDAMTIVVILEARRNSKTPEGKAACDQLYAEIRGYWE